MLKRYLLAPGPTPVPPEALLAMAAPIIHHRTPQFSDVFRRAADRSRDLFGTREPVMMLACSGTGAMEAAVTNTLSPGDHVAIINAGKFGERWVEICRTFNARVTCVDVEWGRAVEPAAVAAVLEANPDIRAILVQASETSTTVLHPVAELGKLTRERECLLIVDGITSVGVVDLPMDTVGIDVLVSGSQKGLMLPPGLSLIALSEKAWRFQPRAKLPRYYFDLAKERDDLAKNTTTYTPPISLIVGLNAVYDLIEANGGFPEMFRRHRILAEATRAGVKAMGLKLLAPEAPSPATTGLHIPAGVDGGALTKYLRDAMGVTVAGGQGKLKGKVVRIGHIGYSDSFDVVVALSALEMALVKLGATVTLGKAVAAAEQVLLEMYPEVARK
jgi:aspartate aminotransferase-like enzyme